MIDAIAEFFSVLISYIYSYVPNFGVSIIVLTLLVKLVTFPLNNKQIQSAKKMQQFQPEMKKIQEKYKDDKEKQNKVMQEFMKENSINPLSGCLPLLVQFPFLFGIFRLLREAETFIVPKIEGFSPYLFPAAERIDLLLVPEVTLQTFFASVSIYYLFPLIAGATTYLHSKMSTSGDSSQKMMLYMMPIMITVFSFSFPVGLVIYWTMNNLFAIGQHKFIVALESSKAGEIEANQIALKDDEVKETDKKEAAKKTTAKNTTAKKAATGKATKGKAAGKNTKKGTDKK